MKTMLKTILAAALALSATPFVARADSWSSYRIPESGTSVDIPVSIFTEMAGKPDGYGETDRVDDLGANPERRRHRGIVDRGA